MIIDVRNPDELKTSGEIPNTINIPLPHIPAHFSGECASEFENDFGVPMPAADDPIIVFCKAGIRAETARQLLISGSVGTVYNNVANYSGSFDEWSQLSSP